MTFATDGIHFSMLYPAIVSAGISAGLIFTQEWHGRFSLDTHEGAQKFHTAPTPRIGGIAMFVAVIIAWVIAGSQTGGLLGLMIIAGLPAFIAGLAEDFTKRVSVRKRLLATMFSGLLASSITGYHIDHIDIAGVDFIFAFLPVSIAFTAFAAGGMANAINIIDGFNGLAGGVLMICFGMFGVIAWQVGDMELVELCLLLVLSIAGFMLFNFPFWKIFMGDGGAYFMGFMLAWTAVMLPMRNPDVSSWVAVVVCAYPLIETMFSMTRRFWSRSQAGKADSEHLHSLIKLHIIKPRFTEMAPHFRNSMVSPGCWLLSIIVALPALFFYNNTSMLILTFVGGYLLYAILYHLVAITLNPGLLQTGHRNHDASGGLRQRDV